MMLANALQAMNLRAKLERLAKLENAVWVTSPLTRAVETFLLSCPKEHLLKPGVPQSSSAARIKVCLPFHYNWNSASHTVCSDPCCYVARLH